MEKKNIYGLVIVEPIKYFVMASTSTHITGGTYPLLMVYKTREEVKEQCKDWHCASIEEAEEAIRELETGRKREIYLDRQNGTEIHIRALL